MKDAGNFFFFFYPSPVYLDLDLFTKVSRILHLVRFDHVIRYSNNLLSIFQNVRGKFDRVNDVE